MGLLGILMYVLPESLAPSSATDTGARTLAFAYLAFAPLFHAFNCRGGRAGLFFTKNRANRYLWMAIAGSAILQALALLIPGLHTLFKIDALAFRDWLIVLAIALLVLPVWEMRKAFLRAKNGRAAAVQTPPLL